MYDYAIDQIVVFFHKIVHNKTKSSHDNNMLAVPQIPKTINQKTI